MSEKKRTELSAFGKITQKLRKDRNVSRNDFAKLCGISLCYLSVIEHGKTPVPNGLVVRISAEYKLTPEEQYNLKIASLEQDNKAEIDISSYDLKTKKLICAFLSNVANMEEEFKDNLLSIFSPAFESEKPESKQSVPVMDID